MLQVSAHKEPKLGLEINTTSAIEVGGGQLYDNGEARMKIENDGVVKIMHYKTPAHDSTQKS